MSALIFKLRTSLGKNLYEPLNDRARQLASIVGLKILRVEDIKKAQAMGMKVKIKT